jgi:SAM-dependent methyltransferase
MFRLFNKRSPKNPPGSSSRAEPEPAPPPMPPPAADPLLLARAAADAEVWKSHGYYRQAESWFEEDWAMVWDYISGVDFRVTIDLAAGHGRNTAMDINVENVEFCRQRFAGDPKVIPIQNHGASFDGIADSSVTFIYCFDAMVHFDMDIIRSYLRDAARVLIPGGNAFFHHSNLTAFPGRDFKQNPHWRSFMSKELFAHLAIISGLEVVYQKVLRWGRYENFVPDIDCFSLVRKPY